MIDTSMIVKFWMKKEKTQNHNPFQALKTCYLSFSVQFLWLWNYGKCITDQQGKQKICCPNFFVLRVTDPRVFNMPLVKFLYKPFVFSCNCHQNRKIYNHEIRRLIVRLIEHHSLPLGMLESSANLIRLIDKAYLGQGFELCLIDYFPAVVYFS